MIAQTQFPFEALLATGMSLVSIILWILLGLALLIAGAYAYNKANEEKKKEKPLQV